MEGGGEGSGEPSDNSGKRIGVSGDYWGASVITAGELSDENKGIIENLFEKPTFQVALGEILGTSIPFKVAVNIVITESLNPETTVTVNDETRTIIDQSTIQQELYALTDKASSKTGIASFRALEYVAYLTRKKLGEL